MTQMATARRLTMTGTTRSLALAAGLLLAGAAGAQAAQHGTGSDQGQQPMQMHSGPAFERMQEMMDKAHEAKSPEERRELMRQHMQAMHDHMMAMRDRMSGMGMKPGMKSGKQGNMQGGEQGSAGGMSAEMSQRMQHMMDDDMPMMRQSMHQMMQMMQQMLEQQRMMMEMMQGR